MYRQQDRSSQGSFWIPTTDLPRSSKTTFYGRLHDELERIGFGDEIRELCAPYYAESGRGRPGIDPVSSTRMHRE